MPYLQQKTFYHLQFNNQPILYPSNGPFGQLNRFQSMVTQRQSDHESREVTISDCFPALFEQIVIFQNNTVTRMSDSQEQGWQNERDISIQLSPERPRPRPLKLEPNNLLSEAYPIEPDMLLGWRPKLPTGPVPLNYINIRSDYILTQLRDNPLYKLVYLGDRLINSVKVNQKYSYSWKERSKYKLNLRLLKETIECVGMKDTDLKPQVCSSSYVFDQSFEGGNLDFAVQVGSKQFDCFVRSDTNTKGHCNWFYFTISNKQQVGSVTLNICNLIKRANLYRKGMRPYISKDNQQWQQSGTNVTYSEQDCRYGSKMKQFLLQFEVSFSAPYQTISIAYGVPYTYTHVERYVRDLVDKYPKLVTVDTLCQSLGGLPLPVLTITDDNNTDKKQVILMSGRIHPGESVSSFVVEGFVNSLLGIPSFAPLLKRYIFKIVPMMNPDGVVVGNFRTSYSGKDLNRQFNNLNKHIFPEAYYLDKLARSLKNEYGSRLVYYFDFHGHSTKTNLFCYGPQHSKSNSYYLKSRAFAKIIEEQDTIFSYQKSIFSISEAKQNTGRALMLKKARIPMSFTFEMSNGLYQSKQGCHALTPTEMRRAGQAILLGFNRYSYFINQLKAPKIRQLKPREKSGLLGPHKGNYSSEILNKRRSSVCRKLTTNPTSRCLLDKVQSPLQHLYYAIIKEELHETEQEEEGGSDSESEAEDLDRVETDLLFQQIVRRNMKLSKGGNSMKLKEVGSYNKGSSLKSEKSEKQHKPEPKQEPQKEPKELTIRPRPIARSLTARIRRPTIPLPVTHQVSQLPIQKEVLIQKHFVLNL